MVAQNKPKNSPNFVYKKNNTRWFLIGSAVVTAALYVIPFGRVFAYPFILMSTLVHEMGHGLSALAVGAHFKAFHMWADGSGVAYIDGQTNRIGHAIIAAGGLIGPAIAAALCFIVAKRDALARISFTILGASLIICEFLFVRNVFGWIFVGGLAATFLWLAQQKRTWLAQTALVFVALQLSLSVFSRMDYLFMPTALTAQGRMPSDVSQIADALFLPYWVWGGVCAFFSLTVLFLGMRSYVRK
jgi:Peptidase M50B-like